MTEVPLKVRYFQREDLEELYKIDRTCFPEDIAFSREELLFYLDHSKSIAWVAEGETRIVGFVLARIEIRYRAHVLTLDVVPEARRCKIGTTLMNELHGELARRGIATSILEVGANNIPAQRLYLAMQYQYLETLLGYYRGREDAYRMARFLPTANSRITL